MAKFWIPKKLDENGNLSTWQGELTGVFDNIKNIGDYCFSYTFSNNTEITNNVTFKNLISTGQYSFNYAFDGCTNITNINMKIMRD